MKNTIRSTVPNQASLKQTILYITNNFTQAEMAIMSAIGSNYNFLIFLNNHHKEYNFVTDYDLPENVKVSSDFKSVIMLTPIFSAAITTVGHISPVLHSKIISILKACISYDLPIIEVPHGLYQWGFNFADDSNYVNTASNTLGAGYPVPTFADHQISWFDNNNIGYPRYRNEKIKKSFDVQVPKYTVITTNTNWFMYDHGDQRILAQSIFEYAKANPERLFIWCHHSAELNATNLINTMLGAKPVNVFQYGYDKDIYFHSIDATEDVIKYSEYGITTVSTCLLDYELHGIPTAIFQSEGLSTVLESMSSGSKFSTPTQLKNLKFEVPKTGKLHEYRVNNFDREISTALQRKTKNKAQNIIMTL